MRVSKYIKAHRDILIEYIYDDGNNIGDSYKILKNIRDNSYSYVAGTGSISNNVQSNQLVKLDSVTNNYGLLNTNTYTFLQLKDFSAGFPLRHDIIKIHVPINYTFGEYLGCHIRVYGFDYNNQFTYDLCNFFFDNTDVNQSYLLNYNSPPLLFQEKLWGKNLTINVPSLYAVSNQRVNNAPKSNSLNYNLTNGLGMSLNSPIFIDFHFITQKKVVNSITTYYLTSKTPISLPQSPDFENLGVKIEHSTNGDFFEIYGVYNGDINQFDNFLNNAVQLGNRYYVTYNVTLYEQNIRGKSFVITVTDNFNEKIEYRPIIKYSTTTAIIDVEMNVIDAVDNSSIYRRASYGMLQDEVAKYSLNLMKINLSNAHKPKIYNIKSPEGAGIFGNKNSVQSPKSQIILEPIKINYSVLVDRFNVVAKSDSVILGKKTFFGTGKLQLLIQPFDNIIQVIIAQDVSSDQKTNDNTNTTELVNAPLYMDLSNMGEIKLVIKNTEISVECGLYLASNQVDLTNGVTVFKIPASKINDIRKIYDSGINVFYITSATDTGTTVIYSGLFKIYDSKDNVASLNAASSQIINQAEPTIISDPNTSQRGTAIAVRKALGAQGATSSTTSTSSTEASSSTSIPSSTIVNRVTYEITPTSNLSIDGFEWSPGQIKKVLNLNSNPTNLTIKTGSLYSNGMYLEKLENIKIKLENEYIKDTDSKEVFSQKVKDFKNNPR